MSLILFSRENQTAELTLNRPDKFNRFNRDMALELQGYLDECAAEEEIRAVVLTGSGKAFCAGQDLAEATDPQGPPLEQIVSDHYNPIILKIRNLEKPVVAAVNGVAAGAGANIALAADIVIAKESASFIQAFSKIGLIPDSGGSYFLPRLLGLQRASALIMLGDKVSANDAKAMGMIYEVYAEEEFDEKSMAVAQRLAQMPTRGLALTKKLLNQTFQNDLEAQLEQEAQHQALAGETEDYREGVSAFLEKRKP